MFGLLLMACNQASSSMATLPTVPRVAILTVTARHEGEKPLGLAAQLWEGSGGEREVMPRPGECVRPPNREGGEAFASRVQVRLGSVFTLPWTEAAGRYGAVGPLKGMDPAYSVGDLGWVSEGESHELAGLLRFGAEPQITGAVRRSDGGVSLSWKAVEAGQLEVQSMGLVCGATREGAEIPWWAVPAGGGEVVLRSTRIQSRMEGERLVVARAVIETVIPLDRSVEESATQERISPPTTPARRPVARRKPSMG